MTYQAEISETTLFFKKIIQENLNEKELDWIKQQEDKITNDFQLRSFYLAFGSASRFIRKKKLQLSEKQIAEADELRKGFQPGYWSVLQFVRVYMLLILPHEGLKNYEEILNRLYETADIDEQVSLYRALPLLPYPEIMVKRATEGIRTNITDVFDAIALNNPYPSDFLQQSAWNQMVLKAVFMQRPLYRIYGADTRTNQELAGMLIDFAHERWAANRKVLPELWRFIGPFMNSTYLADIKKVIEEGDPLERKAGLLACANEQLPESQQLLDKYPDIKQEIKNGKLHWSLIGMKSEEKL